MNLYKISQSQNTNYDTYDSAIVCAEDENNAITIHPSEYVTHLKDGVWYGTYAKGGEYKTGENSWCECKKENFTIELLGKANENINRGVILASFNAG